MKRSQLMRTPISRSRSKPIRGADDKYLAWIRTIPCRCCFSEIWDDQMFSMLRIGWSPAMAGINAGVQSSPTEAAHVGRRGLGQKCPDREAIPLCSEHHRTGRWAHHVLGTGFWIHHGINRDVLVSCLNEMYPGILKPGANE